MTVAELSDRAPEARTPATERRLTAVSRLGVLDRIGDPVLVSLTRLTQSVTGAAAAAVHIFDETHQRRVAASGAALGEHPASDSLCRLVVEDGTRIVCADAVAEPRLAYSSFVAGSDPVRFYASMPLTVSGGATVGTLCAFDTVERELSSEQLERLEDIAELACAHITLLQIATDLGREASQDALTGVSSRALFDDAAAQALGRRSADGSDVLMLVVDLDDFKAINDDHGHAHGDAALRWVASRLDQLVGARGTVGRIGGDEFAVVCEHTGEAAETLIGAIAQAGAGFDPPVSISVGAAFAEAADDVGSLMRRADGRMYAAKAAGRELPYRAARI